MTAIKGIFAKLGFVTQCAIVGTVLAQALAFACALFAWRHRARSNRVALTCARWSRCGCIARNSHNSK